MDAQEGFQDHSIENTTKIDNGYAAFLTSRELINQYILSSNVYSLSFEGSVKRQNKSVKMPYFTQELKTLALKDLQQSDERISEDSEKLLSYPRMRNYLVSLFADSPEESRQQFEFLTKEEKILLFECHQNLKKQVLIHQHKK